MNNLTETICLRVDEELYDWINKEDKKSKFIRDILSLCKKMEVNIQETENNKELIFEHDQLLRRMSDRIFERILNAAPNNSLPQEDLTQMHIK